METKKLQNFYKNKKILVTGSNGFKGSWLSLWLSELGGKVYGVGLKKDNNFLSTGLKINKKIKFYNLDIVYYAKLLRLVDKIKPDIVFHLAGQPIVFEAYRDPRRTFEINTVGTLNILQVSNKIKTIKSLVCVTSDKSYKNILTNKPYKETDIIMGDDPYSGSKSAADIIINSYQKTLIRSNLGVASARAGNVIGGGDFSKNRIIPDLVRSLLAKKKIILRNPNATRPWQYVLDPIHGYLILGNLLYKYPNKYNGAFNFGPEHRYAYPVKKLVNSFLKNWKNKIKIQINNKNKILEHSKLVLDIKKSKKFLKWKPIYDFKKTIFYTSTWYSEIFLNKKRVDQVSFKFLKDFSSKTKFKI